MLGGREQRGTKYIYPREVDPIQGPEECCEPDITVIENC